MQSSKTILTALALAACAPGEPLTTPTAGQQPGTPAVTLDAMGTVATSGIYYLEYDGVPANADVTIVLGEGGLGSGDCFTWLGGQCLGVVAPYRRLIDDTADGTGAGSVGLVLPAGTPLGTYGVQLVYRDGAGSLVSNPLQIEVLDACREDGFGGDTTTAEILAHGDTTAGFACESDDDYFAVTVPDGEELTFDLGFDHSLDGDADLVLRDSAGSFVASSTGVTDTEQVSVQNTSGADDTWYGVVEAFNDRGGDGIDYAITPTLAPIPSATCPPDAFEPNDTTGEAAALVGSTTLLDLTACEADVSDFFSVSVPAGTTITASASFLNTDGDLDVYLYELDGSGNLVELDRAFTTSDVETVEWTNPDLLPNTVYVEVRLYAAGDYSSGPLSGGNYYDLDVDLDLPFP